MSANVEGLIREAMNAIKAGRKDEGKTFLLKAVELDQYNEQAWLWLSGTMDSLDDQRTCLENVLAINPNNERAQQGIAYISQQSSAPTAYSATPQPPSMTNRATASSVEWDTSPAPTTAPSSSWAQIPTPKEPTVEDLDAWVSTLNLPSTPILPAKPTTGASATPFTDFDLSQDMFADGPFGNAATASDAPKAAQKPPPSVPAAAQTPPAPRSPVPAALPSFGFDDDGDDDLFGNKSVKQGGSILYDADTDHDGQFLEEGEGALFGQIPGTIKPTRLPGTRERAPLILVFLSVLLIVVNVLAAALLAIGLLAA